MSKRIITSTYDHQFPKPVIEDSKVIGYGCEICNPSPGYCPYFDIGIECQCISCDIKTDYKPNKIYNTVEELTYHLKTHNLILSEKNIQFISEKLSMHK